jgi:hypothetical protein
MARHERLSSLAYLRTRVDLFHPSESSVSLFDADSSITWLQHVERSAARYPLFSLPHDNTAQHHMDQRETEPTSTRCRMARYLDASVPCCTIHLAAFHQVQMGFVCAGYCAVILPVLPRYQCSVGFYQFQQRRVPICLSCAVQQ